ncbi:hypothetical protein ES703_42314 [subsurface metagenome]
MTDGRFSMLSGDTLPSMNSFLNLYPFLRKFSRIFSKVNKAYEDIEKTWREFNADS